MYVLATYLALVLLATPLHATIPIFLLYSVFAAAVVITTGVQLPENNGKSPQKYYIVIAIILFSVMRIIPFVRWGSSALGADIGAYYGNFNRCFAQLPACAQEPTALLGYLPYTLGFGTQSILLAIHFLANAALLFGIYRIAKSEWGEKPALWSIIVCAVSLPQFLFYWSFFLKMEIGIAFSLFSLHAYAYRKKRAGIYAAIAGMIHPITIVPLASAFIIGGVTNATKRYSFIVASIGIFSVFAFKWNELYGYARYFISYVRGTYAPLESSFLAGHFVGFSFYHNTLMLFYIPFALLVIAWHVGGRKIPIIGWYALINLILISVNAVFHNRFIVMFDISCIILSGYALTAFTQKLSNQAYKKAFITLIILLATYSVYESARMEPLVNPAEFKELRSLKGKQGGLPLFINNATYRQFIAGYTEHMVIFSSFTDEPWKSLPTPSLIYNARRSTPINPKNDPHFTNLSERIIKYSP